MQVRLGILGEVKIDDDVDGLNVDTSREQVGAHEISADAFAEIVENAITVGLKHFSMGVEA